MSKPRSSGERGAAKNSVSDVGYRKPPRTHQFKLGQSGNPKGRPKGRKNEATILDELLFRTIKLREGGRQRGITVLEGILRRFVEDSLRGNTKSADFLLNRYNGAFSDASHSTSLVEDDRTVLAAFAQDFLENSRKEKK